MSASICAQPPAAPAAVDVYTGPERRARTAPRVTPWFAATLDELDFGVVLLSDVHAVVHLNHAARSQLDARHPLLCQGGELRVRHAGDAAAFAEALHAAATRGLRKLLTLGAGDDRVAVSVVPLQTAGLAGPTTTLVMLGKRGVGEALAVEGYARSHRLTGAETRVLAALGRGCTPAEIAAELGVGIATVRTQIGSIRQKTGTESIRALVQQVAALPPLVGVLRGGGARPADRPVAAARQAA